MQSPTQANSESKPGTTATTEHPLASLTEAQPAQSESDAKEKNKSLAPGETETVITSLENKTGVQTAETPATAGVTQAVENETPVQAPRETSENTATGMQIDSASKPSASTEPDANLNPGCDGQKAKKTG